MPDKKISQRRKALRNDAAVTYQLMPRGNVDGVKCRECHELITTPLTVGSVCQAPAHRAHHRESLEREMVYNEFPYLVRDPACPKCHSFNVCQTIQRTRCADGHNIYQMVDAKCKAPGCHWQGSPFALLPDRKPTTPQSASA